MAGKRRRSLALILQEACESPFSPKTGNGTSPMTDLSNIMGGLTCEGSTPRRKLSLSDDTPTIPLSRHSSRSSGISVSSIDPEDAELNSFPDRPTIPCQRSKGSFRRFNSTPTSFDSPLFPEATRPLQTSPRATKKASVLEKSSSLESPIEEDEMVFFTSASTSGNCDKPIEAPKCPDFRTVATKDEFVKPRPVSAPPDLLNQGKVQTTVPEDDNVQLKHSRLTSSHDDDEDGDDDDGFCDELFDSDSQGSITDHQSAGISDLINNPIIRPASFVSPPGTIPLQTMDCNALEGTPEPKCRRGIFKVPSQPAIRRNSSLLKRPDRPRDTPSPIMKKKARSSSIASPLGNAIIKPKRNPLIRSHSTTDMDICKRRIDQKLSRDAEGCNLTGDGTQSHLLPLINGNHKDLNNITPETLARLIQKDFASEVQEFFIVDSRYPYEFNGGHIKGAINLYTRQDIDRFFLNHPMQPLKKRRIVVFHCEFSSQRAPSLLKYLRQEDRNANLENYPDLFYPEVYLLHGGYKNFFETCKELCEPQSYKPMLHEAHGEDLKHFKAKSKSWTGGSSRLGKRQKNLVF